MPNPWDYPDPPVHYVTSDLEGIFRTACGAGTPSREESSIFRVMNRGPRPDPMTDPDPTETTCARCLKTRLHRSAKGTK